MLDTHCHLNLIEPTNPSLQELINNILKKNLLVLNVATEKVSSETACQLHKEYQTNFFAAIGVHPESIEQEINTNKVFDIQYYQKLIDNYKVNAIGEIGLDYYFIKDLSPEEFEKKRELQKIFLIQQINLATKNNLPIVFHVRDDINKNQAYIDLAQIIQDNYKKINQNSAVIHCFTSDWTNAKNFLDLGLKLGFTGIITYDEAKKTTKNQLNRIYSIHEVIKKMPKDKILAETDSPFLLPEPQRSLNINKNINNTPLNVKLVINKIAKLLNINEKDAEKLTDKNGRELFNL